MQLSQPKLEESCPLTHVGQEVYVCVWDVLEAPQHLNEQGAL